MASHEYPKITVCLRVFTHLNTTLTMKTPRWPAWLSLLLIAITTVPSDVTATNMDALASALDKIASRLPQRVRFWKRNVSIEPVSAGMDVPSHDISVNMVNDAEVMAGSVKPENIADCSKDDTCQTVGLYDGDEGEKEEEHVSAGAVDAEVEHKIDQFDDPADTGYLQGRGEDDEDDEEDNDNEDEDEEDDETENEEECFDSYEECDEWASMGECEGNPRYMLTYCKKSCMICGDV